MLLFTAVPKIKNVKIKGLGNKSNEMEKQSPQNKNENVYSR